jgi:hypothetical protein
MIADAMDANFDGPDEERARDWQRLLIHKTPKGICYSIHAPFPISSRDGVTLDKRPKFPHTQLALFADSVRVLYPQMGVLCRGLGGQQDGNGCSSGHEHLERSQPKRSRD